MDLQSIDWSARIAFYPCCGRDIIQPLKLLRNRADVLICCDLRPIVTDLGDKAHQLIFIRGDVRSIVDKLQRIDILFHRNDSMGEGGSGIPVLGDAFLPKIVDRMHPEQAWIVTDGSNSRGKHFERMQRTNGLKRHGKWFQLAKEQPFEHQRLKLFSVIPLTG